MERSVHEWTMKVTKLEILHEDEENIFFFRIIIITTKACLMSLICVLKFFFWEKCFKVDFFRGCTGKRVTCSVQIFFKKNKDFIDGMVLILFLLFLFNGAPLRALD